MSDATDFQRQLAEQRAQAEKFIRDLDTISREDEIGMWFPPAELQGMLFFRCGVRHSDGSMPPGVASLYHKNRAMGAMDAPKGMRPPLGFERDGDLGVYVWFHPDVWANVQRVRAALVSRRPTAAQQLAANVGPGVDITVAKGYDRPRKGR